ncbi:MAG: hypothetical protein E7Z87_00885 [Cyanobacteria bacterium SIG26]|nr:hypothetical protein [Cyanobacteria bacterium SIG26]
MPDQYGETPTEPTGGSVTIGNKNPNITSVSNLSSPQIMTFEECFRLERGVEYNPELVAVYTEKNTTFELMAGLHNRNEAIKQSFNIIEQMEELSETYHFNLKEGNYTDMGGPWLESYIPHCKSLGLPINPKDWGKLVQQNIVESLKMMFGKDVQKAEAYLKQMTNGIDIGWTFSTNQDGEFNITFSNNDLIKSIQIAKNIMQFSNTQYTNALGGKTLEQYSQEASDAYKAAFGKNSVVEVANDFVQSQKEGTGYVKAGAAGIGFVCTVAGTLVPGAQGLVWAGMGLLTVGGTTVSAIENFTKEGGPTEQDWKDMGKELATSLALMGTGMGIGRVSESLFMYMVVRNCPKVLAFLSEVGIDAGLSMMADFIITGEIDLSGEGIAQMLNVLMGIKFGKSNFKEFLNTHAGDIDVARNRYLQENFGLEDQVKQMYKDAGMDYETPPAVKSNETLNDARFETKSQEVSPSGTNTKSKTKSKDQNTPTELTESLSVPDRNIIRHDKSTGNENLINNLTPKAKNKDELVEFFGHLNEIGKNDPEFRKTFTDALNKYLKNNPNAEIDFASYNELLSIAKKYSDNDLSLVKFFGDRDLFTCIENGINPKALNTIINNPEIRLGTQIYKDIIAGKFDNIIDKIDFYFISSYYDKNILIIDHPEMKDDIESIWNSLCKDLESSTSEELNRQIQSDMYDIMKFFLFEYKNIINIKDCKNLLNKGAHITQIANIIRYNSAYDELKQMGGKCAKFADELKTALYKNKYEGYSAEDLNSITKLLYDNIDMLNNNKIGINTEECIKLIKDNTNINSLGYLIGHPEVEVDSHLWTVARSSYLSKFLDNIENNHQAKALLKLMSEGFLTKLDDFETSMIIKFVNDDASFSDLAKLLDVESNDFNIIVKTLNEKYGNNTTTQELDLAIENRNYISRNLDKNPYTYNEEIVEAIERIKANLSHIDDLEVLKYIRTLDLNSSDDLLEIERLIDSFNTLDGKYEMYKVRHSDEIAYWAYGDYEYLSQSQKAEFITWLRSTDPELYKALVNGDKNVKISSDDIAKFNEYRNTHTLTADFTTVARTEEMVRYIGKYPDSPMANHLYNKYLEQQKGIWPDDIINQCKALNDRYGTKVVLGAHYIDETKEVLEFIDNELSCWIAASNGKAKIPPAFDFNNFNQAWYDKSDAYGLSEAGAHSRTLYGGTIGSSETSVRMMKCALRHEMTHTNDLGRYVNIAPEILDAIMPKKTIISNGETTLIPDIENGKYYQELRNAGLGNYSIEYAYTNRDEFLAVAAEGDMSKYSPEFKAILVDMGMPRWLFDIDTPDVKAKAADIRNGNRNITPMPRTLSNEINTSNYSTTPISGDNNIYIKQNQDLEEITTRAINNKKAGNDPSDFGIDTDQLIEALYIKGDYTKIQELNNAGIKHSSNTELQNIGKQ